MHLLKPLLAGSVAAAMMWPVCVNAQTDQSYKQRTNLPTIYIETENSQSITSKEDYVRATLRYVDESGVKVYDALGVRGRGNSTWGLAKKPYRLKFDKKQTFLGSDHAKAKSWTLLANHTDKTLMRNALAAYVGHLAGQPFVPAAQFVDVVLNGEFLGNYQVSDQMEIREKRVDITEQADPATPESNITGGYFLEVDGFADQEPVYMITGKGVKITIKSPDDDIINKDQINYITNHIQKFENALFSKDFTDPEKGYQQYVDPSTLASWYVASEITGNPDAFWSTYIYKKQDDDKIYWGPMWDYDIAFNNCYRKGDMSRKALYQDGYGQDLTGLWVNRMWEDPWFVSLVYEKWQELKAMDIESLMLAFIDEKAAELEQSQKLNFEIWPISYRVYDEYRLFNTYKEGVNYLKSCVKTHLSYLDGVFERQMSAIENVGAVRECIAAYDRAGQNLRFTSPDPNGVVEVFTVAGTLAMRAPMSETVGMSVLPAGMYIVRYSANGITSTLKLVK